MLFFHRKVNHKNLYIVVEEQLYYNYFQVFNSLLETYQKVDIISDIGYVLAIYEKQKTYLRIYFEDIIYLQCNCNSMNWIFFLICQIEDWYASILGCTILHGSCIRFNNSYNHINVLFMGARKSGKTTLTQYLVNNKDCWYLDDDCVYICSNSYVGFNMPIMMREDRNVDSLKNAIFTTLDGENQKRGALRAKRVISECKKIDYIFFPSYSEEIDSNISIVSKGDLFTRILHNVRSCKDTRSLFLDISIIVKSLKSAYSLQYANSEKAYEMIKTVIEDRKSYSTN